MLAAWVAGQASSLSGFLVAALLAGLGHGYGFPVLVGQVVERTEQRYRGSALAMFTALWGASELVLSPAFGAIADHHGDGMMFGLLGMMGIGSLTLWVLLEHRHGAGCAHRAAAETLDGAPR